MRNLNLNEVGTASDSTRRAKYLKNLRELSMTKNKSWITRMAKAGFLGVNISASASSTDSIYWKPEWKEQYLQQLFDIMDTLEVAHPGNWDMHIQEHNNRRYGQDNEKKFLFSLHPIIRYPEFTITNSNDEEAEIKELIVSMPLSLNNSFTDFQFEINYIKGSRYHFCYEQYTSGYVHSHLTSRSYPSGVLDTFCLGEDDIADLLSEMLANGFEKDMFGLLIATLDNMIRWESLEGVPYNYIRDIVSADKNTRMSLSISDISTIFQTKFRTWLNDQRDFPVNFVYNKGRYQIKLDDTYNQFIKKFVLDYGNGLLINQLLCKEKDGHYYAPKQSQQNDIPSLLNASSSNYGYSEPPYTYISGKKITTHIRKTQFNENEDINTFNVHPKFLDYVAIQLERELYEKAVTSSAVEARAELNNA